MTLVQEGPNKGVKCRQGHMKEEDFIALNLFIPGLVVSFFCNYPNPKRYIHS